MAWRIGWIGWFLIIFRPGVDFLRGGWLGLLLQRERRTTQPRLEEIRWLGRLGGRGLKGWWGIITFGEPLPRKLGAKFRLGFTRMVQPKILKLVGWEFPGLGFFNFGRNYQEGKEGKTFLGPRELLGFPRIVETRWAIPFWRLFFNLKEGVWKGSFRRRGGYYKRVGRIGFQFIGLEGGIFGG